MSARLRRFAPAARLRCAVFAPELASCSEPSTPLSTAARRRRMWATCARCSKAKAAASLSCLSTGARPAAAALSGLRTLGPQALTRLGALRCRRAHAPRRRMYRPADSARKPGSKETWGSETTKREVRAATAAALESASSWPRHSRHARPRRRPPGQHSCSSRHMRTRFPQSLSCIAPLFTFFRSCRRRRPPALVSSWRGCMTPPRATCTT